MAIHSVAFTAIRALQVLVAIPIIGMLGYFVDNYRTAHSKIPDRLLAFFIISILAAAWALFTLHQFRKLRNISGPLIAAVDLLFMGAFIACVILYRGVTKSDCGRLSVPIGVTLGDKQYGGGNGLGLHVQKECAMTKSSWALAIAEIVFFFATAILSWMLYKHYKNGGAVVHTKESRRSGSTSTYSTHRNRRHRGTYAV